jgi:hypothetical protein
MFACLNGPSLAVGGAVVLELSADYCIALRNDGGASVHARRDRGARCRSPQRKLDASLPASPQIFQSSHPSHSPHRHRVENPNTLRNSPILTLQLDVCFGAGPLLVIMNLGWCRVRDRGDERDRNCS